MQVAVRLKDSVYRQPRSDVVRLIVIANIMLNPSLVYLLPGAEVTYQVELIGQTVTSGEWIIYGLIPKHNILKNECNSFLLLRPQKLLLPMI